MLARLGMLPLVAVAACIEPQLVPCGDQVCPAHSTCIAGELCATTEQTAACEGLIDGDHCTTVVSGGVCDRGVCVPTRCGNLVVDAGETCDDGNTTSGDGCRSDCRKLETCGDAELDDGEGCDDGNHNPVDGCDACMPTHYEASVLVGGNTLPTAIGLAQPQGFAIDRRGNAFIADTYANVIRRVDIGGAITIIAGTGTIGFDGDGNQATSARLNHPTGIAVDGIGNVYIADSENNRIRRIETSGIITTIAGNGTPGPAGDGGPAVGAQLQRPQGVTVDGFGSVYIADTFNHRIRRVDTSGLIATIAGTGALGYGGDNGPATSAALNRPYDVALDPSGNLFIADQYNDRVRKRTPAGVITTVAQVLQPSAVEADATGALYIGELAHVDRLADGTLTIIAGAGSVGFGGDGGPAIDALIHTPSAIALDPQGNVCFADRDNNRIRCIDSAGHIATVAGTGASGSSGDGGAATSITRFASTGLALGASGALYAAERDNDRVRQIALSGVITTIAGNGVSGATGDGGPAIDALLRGASHVTVDTVGNLYIADEYNHEIRRVDTAGVITRIAGTGTSGFSGDGGPAAAAMLYYPRGLAVDSTNNIYIADAFNNRVRRIDATGTITTVAGTGTAGATGDGGAATSATLDQPSGIAVDGAGNLYIADSANHKIRKVSPTGTITTVAGTGTPGGMGDGGLATAAQLSGPEGVAIDPAGGFYIADTFNRRVRHVDAAGMISSTAGTGASGATGDGGLATAAQLGGPMDIVCDASGTLYVADGSRIRRVDAAGTITTVAGHVDPEGMGPITNATLADPRSFVIGTSMTLVAGGSSGTVQRLSASSLDVVAGRYSQPTATGALARFRDTTFGEIGGVAFDEAAALIYLTESTANRVLAVHIEDPADVTTWTIAPLANTAGLEGFADGAADTARFRRPDGLYFDPAARLLYVVDTGNHALRAIDLNASTVQTIAGSPETRGFEGDGGPANTALMFVPEAVARCTNGDLFVADTGNHRVRRIAAGTGLISTVLGVGVAASSGEGRPASVFPVDAPRGVACDELGNVIVASTSTVRLLPADDTGVVDGTGPVLTIYGAAPRDRFPENVTRCLTGIASVDATTVRAVDSCTGLLIELRLEH